LLIDHLKSHRQLNGNSEKYKLFQIIKTPYCLLCNKLRYCKLLFFAIICCSFWYFFCHS